MLLMLKDVMQGTHQIHSLYFLELLIISRLKISSWLNRVLYHKICIPIRAIELQIELYLRYFQL
jgi:hypothetical protein